MRDRGNKSVDFRWAQNQNSKTKIYGYLIGCAVRVRVRAYVCVCACVPLLALNGMQCRRDGMRCSLRYNLSCMPMCVFACVTHQIKTKMKTTTTTTNSSFTKTNQFDLIFVLFNSNSIWCACVHACARASAYLCNA